MKRNIKQGTGITDAVAAALTGAIRGKAQAKELLKGKAMRDNIKKTAQGDVITLTNAEGAIREQEGVRKHLAVERGVQYASKKVTPYTESAKRTDTTVGKVQGLNPMGVLYLSDLEAAMMAQRKEKKASDYTRYVKSTIGGIMAAINVQTYTGKTVNIERKVKQPDGKRVTVSDKVDDVAKYLDGLDGSWHDAVRLARIIKVQCGYKPNRGDADVKDFKDATIQGVVDTWTGRLNIKTALIIMDKVVSEARSKFIKHGNKAMLDTSYADFRDKFMRIALDQVKGAEKLNNVVTLGAPKQDVTAQPEKKERKQRKAA